MSKKNKSIKITQQQTPKIKLPPATNIDWDALKPAFSFREMQYCGKACLSQCDKQAKLEVVGLILKISQLTWRTIQSQSRNKLGYEVIPYNQFRIALPKVVTEDTNLCVFRFSLSGRVIGYRIQDILHIVAIDPHHKAY